MAKTEKGHGNGIKVASIQSFLQSLVFFVKLFFGTSYQVLIFFVKVTQLAMCERSATRP